MTLFQDCAHAWRRLTRSPALVLTAVVTLAVGIGANAALFVALDRLLLREPTGVRQADQVVRLYLRHVPLPGAAMRMAAVASYGDFADMRDGLGRVADAAGYLSHPNIAFRTGTVTRPVTVSLVTGDYFRVLGVRAERGRPITASSGTSREAVVSHWFWSMALGSDPGAIGRPIELGGQMYELVGVMQNDFAGLDADAPAFWLPMSAEPAFGGGPRWFVDHDGGGVKMFARPRAGVSDAAVASAARTIASRLDVEYPSPFATRGIVIGPLNWPSDSPLEGLVLFVPLMLGAITIAVLIVAVANVTYLLLVRAARRAGETAVRVALGATRSHIVRGQLLEALLISGLGGAGAVLLLSAATLEFRGALPPALAGSVGFRGIAFTAVMTVMVGMAIGVVVAIWSSGQAANPFLVGQLKTRSRSRLMATVTAVQVASAVPLLALTTLAATSVRRSHGRALGFNPNELVVASVADDAGGATPDSAAPSAERFARLRRTIAALPGVKSAALGRTAPFGPIFSVTVLLPHDARISVAADYVGEDFFRTLQLPLLRGRGFRTRGDMLLPGAVISRALDEQLRQTNTSETGCVRIEEMATAGCLPIVGVSEDANLSTLTSRPAPKIYLPLDAFGTALDKRMQLYVRVRAISPGIIHAIDSLTASGRDGPRASSVSTLSALIQPLTKPWIVASVGLGGCALLATMLALVGLFGTTAFVVEQAKPEIAVRLALGSTRGRIVRLFLFRSLGASTMGALAGSVLAIAGTRLGSSVLFDRGGVGPYAVAAAIASILVCLVVTAIAPVRRASAMNLIGALRSSGQL